MKWHFWQEMKRKTIHMILLVILTGYWAISQSFGKTPALMMLTGLLLGILMLEYLRLELDIKMNFLDFIIKPRERNSTLGSVNFIITAIICLAVFDFRIALSALLMATFGDMAASIIGQKYGHALIFREKTIIGGISETVINLIIGAVVLINHSNIYIIIAMALTATVTEVLVKEIDGNLVIPIATGFVGQLLTFL